MLRATASAGQGRSSPGAVRAHRQLLALSPYCVLPRGPAATPARSWLNLLPLIRIADNVTMHGSEVRSLLDRADYERLLRMTWALLRAESCV